MKFPFHLRPLSDQIRSVAQSRPTLCDPMNCSTPGLPVHRQLPEFTQTHGHRVSDAIQPSHPLSSPSPAPNPSLPMSQLFAWGGQSTGVSALASFLPKKSQGWSSEWTGWISYLPIKPPSKLKRSLSVTLNSPWKENKAVRSETSTILLKPSHCAPLYTVISGPRLGTSGCGGREKKIKAWYYFLEVQSMFHI